jgi:hypothetical protein
LSGVDEIELYLRQGDFDEARAITDRIAGTASLLDDLGWDPHGAAERFVLHGDRVHLRAVIERLRDQAEDSLRDQAEWITGEPAPGLRPARDDMQGLWREEIQRSVDEDLDTRLVCDHILEVLDRDVRALASRLTN